MWQGVVFISLCFAFIGSALYLEHEHFKSLTPAETTGAACYKRGGPKAFAGCVDLCEMKWPNDPGCKLQLLKEYE